jgi:uncharacterized damage-inducible protein DinB
MNNALLDVLFKYDSWATRRLLEECRGLNQEQFERPLGLGHGNLEQTLAHLVGAMMFFADRLNRQPPRSRPDRDGRFRTAAELLTLFETTDRELREAITTSLASHALTDILNWTDDDTGEIAPLDQIPYAVAFAQMIDHGIHHRTQAVDMLRLLDFDRSMEWHPFEWDEAMRNQT